MTLFIPIALTLLAIAAMLAPLVIIFTRDVEADPSENSDQHITQQIETWRTGK
jgi:hypothetical protein